MVTQHTLCTEICTNGSTDKTVDDGQNIGISSDMLLFMNENMDSCKNTSIKDTLIEEEKNIIKAKKR